MGLRAVRKNITAPLKKQIKSNKVRIQKTSPLQLKRLQDYFDVKIGIVVGATKLLVMNEEEAKKSPYYPEYTYPIITKGKQLNGVSITTSELIQQNSNSPIYIIDAVTMELESPELFEKLLISIPTDVLLNQTFQNRPNLFGYDDYKTPDAFLTFYSQHLAKIIINEDRELNCTNSVHRLYLKKNEEHAQALLKLFALQTYSDVLHSQTRAVSRQYGNYIIKFEPSDAANIPLLVPRVFNSEITDLINKTFDDVKFLISEQNLPEAKIFAASLFNDLLQN